MVHALLSFSKFHALHVFASMAVRVVHVGVSIPQVRKSCIFHVFPSIAWLRVGVAYAYLYLLRSIVCSRFTKEKDYERHFRPCTRGWHASKSFLQHCKYVRSDHNRCSECTAENREQDSSGTSLHAGSMNWRLQRDSQRPRKKLPSPWTTKKTPRAKQDDQWYLLPTPDSSLLQKIPRAHTSYRLPTTHKEKERGSQDAAAREALKQVPS